MTCHSPSRTVACWLAAIVMMSGCFVVPRDTVVDAHVVGRGVTHNVGKPGELGLYASEDGNRLTVQLVAKRMCSEESYEIVETTVGKTVGITGAGGPSGIVGAVLAVITVPTSALVTGIIIAGSSDSTTQKRFIWNTRSYPCALAGAHQRVTLVLPSGDASSSETDDKGHAVFDLQGSEPVTGIVSLRADHARPTSYRLGGDANEQLPLPVSGARPEVAGPPEARERAWHMTKAAAAAARAGDCASVRTAHEQIRRIDPVFHDAVFMHEVEIARCIDDSPTGSP